MHYNVGRDGQQLGQFSEEEIRAGLFEGRYLPTDMGWTEGMPDWRPLGELFGAVPPAIPMRTVSTATSGGHSVSHAAPNSGMAIAALVLGIVSALTCGLLGVGALAAIVCGHLALSRIKMSQGAEGGRGMALSGLILGYLSLVVAVVVVGASLVGPVFSRVQERGNLIHSISNAKQVIVACKIYASDHEGKWPESLEVLLQENLISDPKILRDVQLKDDTQIAFDYHGAGVTDDMSGNKIVLTGKYVSPHDGKQVIGRLDGTVVNDVLPASP